MLILICLLCVLLCDFCSAQLATTTSIIFSTSIVCPCTSSTSIASTPVLPLATPSVSAPLTTQLPLSSSTPFPIRIDTGPSLQRRSFFYVGFDNDTAIGVAALDRAALFTIVNSYLLNDGMYVGTNTTQGYQSMRRYSSAASVIPGWSLDRDSAVSLDGLPFTLGDGTAQFCVSNQGAVILQITQPAPACDDADLAALPKWVSSS